MRRAITALCLFAVPGLAEQSPMRVSGGLIAGSSGGEIRSYKGIPYADPPVGSLRWKAPQPVVPWKNVRNATTFSSGCPQARTGGGGPGESEDCLYLNVWTGAAGNEKRPVMVWIHGGGFINGSGSVGTYDGEHFAKKGVVLVT